jgi:hypothetical protein
MGERARAAVRWVVTPALAAILTSGCAGSRPLAAPISTSAPVARAEPRPVYHCRQRDPEWEAWEYHLKLHGTPPPVEWPRDKWLQRLRDQPKEVFETMVRRGIQACDESVLDLITDTDSRSLMPELLRAVGADNTPFGVSALLTLKKLGSTDDFTNDLIAALQADAFRTRSIAAGAAHQFPLSRVRAPLIDRVRRDPSPVVREEAASSLLDLADLYPRFSLEYPEIACGVDPFSSMETLLREALDRSSPLSADDLAACSRAAERLDALITARLAGGRCTKPVTLTFADPYVFFPGSSHNVVALTVEESIGSCERSLAFVVFVQSPGGFSKQLLSDVSKFPLKIAVAALPTEVSITYENKTKRLVVGNSAFEGMPGNVVVVSADRNGIVTRFQTADNLTFARHGRPPREEFRGVSFEPEIIAAVQALLARSPALRQQVVEVPETKYVER